MKKTNPSKVRGVHLPRTERVLSQLQHIGFTHASALRREYRELDRLYHGKVNLFNVPDRVYGCKAERYKYFQSLDKLPLIELKATLTAGCLKMQQRKKQKKALLVKH